MPRSLRTLAAALGAAALLQHGARAQKLESDALQLSLFERYLESLRQQAGIPGLSAVIVQDGAIAWERGMGSRDVENLQPATPDTPYPIADLTQTFAAVLLMQCYERGQIELSDPVPNTTVSVRQALSHTTNVNGTGFHYDPETFAKLTSSVDACGGVSARLRVAHDVFERLGMVDSVPGRDLLDLGSAARSVFDAAELERYRSTLTRLAVPYKVDRRGKPTRSDFASTRIDAATGLISTARDLQRFDSALDHYDLLRSDTISTMWSNVTGGGTTRPTGLGWFVQTYNNERIVWHFGYVPDAYSSLILKVPAKRLTLILLANSDGLSAPFDLAQGDVTTSVFAVTFLRLFL